METTIIGHISCSFGVRDVVFCIRIPALIKRYVRILMRNCFDMRSGLWTFGFGGSLDCLYHAAVEFL